MNWITPTQGQKITDVGLQLILSADPGAEFYTVEYAQNEKMEGARKLTIRQEPDCRYAYYIPTDEELPSAGRWYFVATSNKGSRTSALAVDIDTDHPKNPLRRKISPENPYITIMDWNLPDKKALYELMPDTLKPYVAVGSSASHRCESDEIQDALMEFDAKGVPWQLSAAGPHVVYDGRYVITPLPVIEYLLQHAKNLQGVGLLENYLGVREPHSWRINYFKRIMILCAKYGYNMFHTDGNRNYLDMASFIVRPVYMDFCREYAEYFTLSYKQNHANASYSVYGAILGAWMDDACANIGIQAENWYWNDAGFRDDIGNCYGYLQGNEQQIPACFTAEMLLPGLGLGACYYSLEGEGWMVRSRGKEGYEFSDDGLAVLSLLSTVVSEGLIPAKDKVVEQVKACAHADGWADDLGDAWVGGAYRTIFQRLYDIEHEFELFPRKTRYFHLPLVTDREATFAGLARLNAGEIKNPDDVYPILDPLYAPWYDGDAFATRTGGAFVVLNSNENKRCAQYFQMDKAQLQAAGLAVLKGISAPLDLWQYLLFWEQDGLLRLHLNAPAGSSLVCRLAVDEGCQVQVNAPHLRWRRDPSDQALILELTGTNVPVEIGIGPKADGKALPALLANAADDKLYLSDLPYAAVETSGGILPTKDVCSNLRYGQLPICINKLRYAKGISYVRGGRVRYALGGQYKRLQMTCGFDIDAWMPIIIDRDNIIWDRHPRDVKLVFTLLGDGKAMFTSPEISRTDWKQVLDLDISGIDTLEFVLEGSVISDDPQAEVYMDIGNPILN